MDAPRGVQGLPGGTRPAASKSRRELTLVNDFAVKGEIEAVALHLVERADRPLCRRFRMMKVTIAS